MDVRTRALLIHGDSYLESYLALPNISFILRGINTENNCQDLDKAGKAPITQ